MMFMNPSQQAAETARRLAPQAADNARKVAERAAAQAREQSRKFTEQSIKIANDNAERQRRLAADFQRQQQISGRKKQTLQNQQQGEENSEERTHFIISHRCDLRFSLQ
jgi:hypothetical protein